MTNSPKGRKEFTATEIEKLRGLIREKCSAPSSKQKSIRDKMRDLGFYITDFRSGIKSVEEFNTLIKNGEIICTDSTIKHPNQSSKHIHSSEEIKESINSVNQINKKGLEAVIGEDARVLILGTLPGDESILQQKYYSKAGNRFWEVIYGIFDTAPIPQSYDTRIEFLKEHGIALWDVLAGAVREGSLDSNIEQEKPNDLKSFLADHPTIEIIAFNGKKAEEMFSEYFSDLLTEGSLTTMTLLSTSSANRQFPLSEMKKNWSQILHTPSK